MKGYHQVKHFHMSGEMALPAGWKPFAAFDGPNGTTGVIARKWVRLDTAPNFLERVIKESRHARHCSGYHKPDGDCVLEDAYGGVNLTGAPTGPPRPKPDPNDPGFMQDPYEERIREETDGSA